MTLEQIRIKLKQPLSMYVKKDFSYSEAEFKKMIDELSSLTQYIDISAIEYYGPNPETTKKELVDKGIETNDALKLLSIFISKGNNIDNIIKKSSGKTKSDLIRLKHKYSLKKTSTSADDITLSRVAVAMIELWPMLKSNKVIFNLLNLEMSQPRHWLAIPGAATMIPKDSRYNGLFRIVLDYQNQIHKIIGKGKPNKAENICNVMRNGEFLQENKRLELLRKLNIIDDNGDVLVS
uniref:RNA-dependent RNA polymerase n=1 Tax=Strongyloides papillosus TaxID=174720 RepID=A0A0N5B8U4_STREA